MHESDHRCLKHRAEAIVQRVSTNDPRPYRLSLLIGRSKAVDGRPMHDLEDGILGLHQPWPLGPLSHTFHNRNRGHTTLLNVVTYGLVTRAPLSCYRFQLISVYVHVFLPPR